MQQPKLNDNCAALSLTSWKVRIINKSEEIWVTHQAPANRWSLFSCMMSIVARFFSFSGPRRCSAFCFCNGRTDTLPDNNDHLFGRGQVGQYPPFLLSRSIEKLLIWLRIFSILKLSPPGEFLAFHPRNFSTLLCIISLRAASVARKASKQENEWMIFLLRFFFSKWQ